MNRPPHPLDFFKPLRWIDGTPLLKTIEPYRQKTFVEALYTFKRGIPRYDLVLCGRGKKNWKTSDLILAALYRFLAWPTDKGNDAFILANDEGQAADDLALAKKLIAANPALDAEVTVYAKEIVRRDELGALRILPAKDAIGAHGKTYIFCGFDEIHGYRNHDLFEALAPDPSRPDALIWITSYAGIRHAPGIPLYDFMQAGKRGDDERMFFSWYAADFTTDESVPDDATPEERANPSLASWGNDNYLAQQKRRLPSNKYRRLHLNLPGAPDGAAFDSEAIMRAVIPGQLSLPPEPGTHYFAFVDMSGGSSDDATLGIAHADGRRVVLDLVVCQTGKPRFNPRHAVKKFAAILHEYGVSQVTGDRYAGETFRADFQDEGIAYKVCTVSKSDLYEALEPRLNAGEVDLPDVQKLTEQLLTLVYRGANIDHQPGDHDDFANAAAGAIWLMSNKAPMIISDALLARAKRSSYRPGCFDFSAQSQTEEQRVARERSEAWWRAQRAGPHPAEPIRAGSAHSQEIAWGPEGPRSTSYSDLFDTHIKGRSRQ